MGFGATLRVKNDRTADDAFADVMPEDLLKFGMIPEFIGRLPVITSVHNLDRDALIQILTEPRNALVKQYRRLFELDGVDLEFTDDALEAVADQAILRGTGARGLRAILEEVLLSVMYEVPEPQGRRAGRDHRAGRAGARQPDPGARATSPAAPRAKSPPNRAEQARGVRAHGVRRPGHRLHGRPRQRPLDSAVVSAD